MCEPEPNTQGLNVSNSPLILGLNSFQLRFLHSMSPRPDLPALLLLFLEWRVAAQHFEDGQRELQGCCAPALQRHHQYTALLWQRCEDGCPAAEPRAAVWEPAGGIWTHRHEGLRVQWGRTQVVVMLLFVVSQPDFEKFRIFLNWCMHVILKTSITFGPAISNKWLSLRSAWSSLQHDLPSQNLVRAGSSLLDPANKEHWDQIQRTEGGTAHLLRNFEDYANTLAQNVRKTYLKPFTIVTDNMSEWKCCQHTVKDNYARLHPWTLLLAVLTVDYLDVTDPERATLPRFEDISEAYPKELGSCVQFPQFSLRPQGHRGS